MNRIPRKFSFIYATLLTGAEKGHLFRIHKDEYGYHAYDTETGKLWLTFADNIRNPNFYRIEKIV